MQFKSSPSTGNGGKNFIKLKDGESVQGVFRGNPLEFHVVWKDRKSHVVDESTAKAQFRFRINLIINENGAMVSKIFEQGATVYNQLKELHDEYDLEATPMKITRRGNNQDTTYTIMPMLKNPLTKDAIAKIQAVELLDLGHKREETHDQTYGGVFDAEDDTPF